MRPNTFKEVYRAVKRIEVEQVTQNLFVMNQAMNGTQESITKFISSLDVWGEKRLESPARIQEFQAMLTGGKK